MEYVAAAAIVNTVYGAATGESGGLIGEAFGVQDKIDSQQAQAKQEALDRSSAAQKASSDAASAAIAKAAESSLITNPPATTNAVTLATPPAVTTPPAMPNVSTSMQAGRKASIAEQRRRQGRASTILTDTLGGS